MYFGQRVEWVGVKVYHCLCYSERRYFFNAKTGVKEEKKGTVRSAVGTRKQFLVNHRAFSVSLASTEHAVYHSHSVRSFACVISTCPCHPLQQVPYLTPLL